MMKTNWDEVFKNNHLHSWPTNTLKIAKTSPPGGRKIYSKEEDKSEIDKAALKNGFRKLWETNHSVDFIKP